MIFVPCRVQKSCQTFLLVLFSRVIYAIDYFEKENSAEGEIRTPADLRPPAIQSALC